MSLRIKLLSCVFVLFSPVFSLADEGMWTFNHFPSQQVEKKYQFKVTDPWLEKVRLSSARLAGGCSASFVSSTGLVMTNHHCAHSCIEQLSTAQKDFVASGFLAKKIEEEVRCPEIEINRLIEIKDVTAEIRKATQGLSDKKFNDAQKAAMAKMEKACSGDQANLRCDVVTLFHGGKYNLYKYQRYQDVRLVFAPEFAAAFFGGDPDNFMFPRYDFDLTFLRVYEDHKPLQNKDYLRWSDKGAADEELVFVTGHPGGTSRLLTVAELEFTRDVKIPQSLLSLAELRGILVGFQKRGAEQHRIANGKLFGVENSFKALKGRYETLLDKKVFAEKVAAEKKLRSRVNANPKWKKDYGSAWDELAKVQQELKKIYLPLSYIEQTNNGSRLYNIAKILVRLADELPKPNESRYREYTDSNLPRIQQDLFSTAPIYDEFEIEMLTFSLTKLREVLFVDHPFVKKVLGPQSPEEKARALIRNTKLKDVQYRRTLFEGGKKAILESKDPLIQFLLLIDPDARAVREQYESQIEPVIKKNREKVAQAQFAVEGDKTYPDATFTLRISYGQVKGYEQNGQQIKPFTTISGAFERQTGREPFALPESWNKNKEKLNLQTPLNFVTTNDIIGGNSGSPMINKQAEVVGLIFDGNIQSLGGEYIYDIHQNRTVAVHSAAIMDILKNVYGAQRIIDDIRSTTSETGLKKAGVSSGKN